MIQLFWKNATDKVVGPDHGITATDLSNIDPAIRSAHETEPDGRVDVELAQLLRFDFDVEATSLDTGGELVRRQVGIHAGVVVAGPFARRTAFDVALVVFHEHGIVVEPPEPTGAQQMGEPVRAGLELAIAHGLAA